MTGCELKKKLNEAIKLIRCPKNFDDNKTIELINICALAELYIRNRHRSKFDSIGKKIDKALKKTDQQRSNRL